MDLVVDRRAGGAEVGLEHRSETVATSLLQAALGMGGVSRCRKTTHRSLMGQPEGNESSLLINSMQLIIIAGGNEQEMNLKDSSEHENKNTASTKSIRVLWLRD